MALGRDGCSASRTTLALLRVRTALSPATPWIRRPPSLRLGLMRSDVSTPLVGLGLLGLSGAGACASVDACLLLGPWAHPSPLRATHARRLLGRAVGGRDARGWRWFVGFVVLAAVGLR